MSYRVIDAIKSADMIVRELLAIKAGEEVVLVADPETDMEMVALQAICGSDPYREASNVLRVRQLDKVPEFWRRRWNVLYAADLAPDAQRVFKGALQEGEK